MRDEIDKLIKFVAVIQLTLEILKYFCINHGDQRFLQFEIIINVLVVSFRFIWIPMLWVYGHYIFLYKCLSCLIPFYLNTYVMGLGPFFLYNISVRRSTLDVRIWRLRRFTRSKGYNVCFNLLSYNCIITVKIIHHSISTVSRSVHSYKLWESSTF